MLRNICKTIAVVTFAAAVSLPAAGQISLRFGIPLPPSELEIRVGHRAPPRALSEHRSQRPGRDYLWIRGSWDYQRNDWRWVPGRWARPDQHGSRWVKARYTREGPGWRYEPAHWSHERLVEGDEYRRWRSENGRMHGHDGNRDHDDNRDRRDR